MYPNVLILYSKQVNMRSCSLNVFNLFESTKKPNEEPKEIIVIPKLVIDSDRRVAVYLFGSIISSEI